MATIYTQISKNIWKTWAFISGFVVFIMLVGWLFSYSLNSPGIVIFAALLSVIMTVVSYWNSDKIILATSGARPVSEKDNPELYHLVENLSITAGLPTPRIYIVEDQAMNAFATGRDPKHAIIVFTRGILNRLNRVELEGVAAHELSHVGNRDTLLSSVVVILVGLISLAAQWFLRISFWSGGRRGNDREGNAGAILFLLSIVAALLAPLAATLMQLAISRRRESLADASGALLTRYPEGLASALEKIAQDPNQLRTASPATAHLYIENPFKSQQKTSWFVKLFMTHPPTEERIRALREMGR